MPADAPKYGPHLQIFQLGRRQPLDQQKSPPVRDFFSPLLDQLPQGLQRKILALDTGNRQSAFYSALRSCSELPPIPTVQCEDPGTIVAEVLALPVSLV